MVRKAKLRCHGSRGRRRLTGLRDDAPSEARGADGGRATHGHTKPPPDGHHSGDKAAPRRTPPWHERAHPRRTPPGHDKAAHGHTHHLSSPGFCGGLFRPLPFVMLCVGFLLVVV